MPADLATLPACPRLDPAIWLMIAPVLSTEHLPSEELADVWALHDRVTWHDTDPCGSASVILKIADDQADLPPRARAVATACRALGYHYLRFDRDGSIYSNFPTFDQAGADDSDATAGGAEVAFSWSNAQAASEGWGLFHENEGLRLERIDDWEGVGGFASDWAAVLFVREQAAAGSSYHAEALRRAAADVAEQETDARLRDGGLS